MGELRADSLEQPTAGREDGAVVDGDEESDGEFEFSFASSRGSASGDELFADGRIRAMYPVFGRAFDDAHAPVRRPLGRLFLEEARNTSVGSSSSSSSSSSADIDPDSYCVWVPGASPASSPSRSPRKSGSTGSIARWRRVSDFVTGRSHSAGRNKFLFLSAPSSPARETKGKPRGRINNRSAATELDTVAADHRMFYGAKASPGSPRRTFLPYRQDLVGLFSKTKGLNRNHHQTGSVLLSVSRRN